MAEHGSDREKVDGPKRDGAVVGEGGDRQDAEVPSGAPPEGGVDPKEIAEGEATRGGYG
jgi:hypothetical protein